MDQRVPFDAYVVARSQALQRFAYLVCRDAHLAEDLVQEALSHAYGRWARLDEPEAYLKRSIVNQLTSWRRRRWYLREVSEAEIPDREVFDVDRASDWEAVWSMLGTLPPRPRAVLVLRFYDDADDHTIARMLGCSEATVRAHAARGLARLRNATTIREEVRP